MESGHLSLSQPGKSINISHPPTLTHILENQSLTGSLTLVISHDLKLSLIKLK
jgi:hypothetical protein